jgi:protein-S-isoprenylcysteine O-methyltransferase Ste14
MIWLWIRALIYMFLVGGGWLVVIPVSVLAAEASGPIPQFRSGILGLVGICVCGLGAVLAVWSGYYLIRHGYGTPFPFDPPQRLVTIGPYRRVRNPQAIAMLLMILGEVVAIQSSLLWVLIPITIIYLEFIIAPLEARQMRRRYGCAYDKYAAAVAKWAPSM